MSGNFNLIPLAKKELLRRVFLRPTYCKYTHQTSKYMYTLKRCVLFATSFYFQRFTSEPLVLSLQFLKIQFSVMGQCMTMWKYWGSQLWDGKYNTCFLLLYYICTFSSKQFSKCLHLTHKLQKCQLPQETAEIHSHTISLFLKGKSLKITNFSQLC